MFKAFLSMSFVAALAMSANAEQVKSNNELGLALMRETVAEDVRNGKVQNTMVSGTSALSAFSMLYGGLEGATLKGLGEFLNTPYTGAEYASTANQYFTSLLKTASKPRREGDRVSPTVNIVNSAWSTDGATTHRPFVFAESYKGVLTSSYSAEIKSMDFKKPEAAKAVNAWADVKTNGLIKEIIDADTMKDLVWLLMNATYFEGNWEVNFSDLLPEYTPAFKKVNGSESKVKMFRGTQNVPYLKNAVYESASIPFYGSELAFVVVKPTQVSDFLKGHKEGSLYSSEFWKEVIANLQLRSNPRVEITMPEFAFDYSATLRKDEPLTKALGLNFLFQDENAQDFSPMGTKESPATMVGLIKQSTRIEVDKSGVKAAAVTIIGGAERSSMPPRTEAKLVLDQPFVYAIYDRSAQTLLFVGALVEPTAKK